MAQSQRSYFLKSGALSILDKGSAFVFGFGSIYFITRLLERDDFKVWILFYTLISFLEVSRIGLQQNALVKYLSTAKADEEGLISSASFLLNIFITSITVGIILATATPLAKFYGDPVLRDILMVYCLTSILNLILFSRQNSTSVESFSVILYKREHCLSMLGLSTSATRIFT